MISMSSMTKNISTSMGSTGNTSRMSNMNDISSVISINERSSIRSITVCGSKRNTNEKAALESATTATLEVVTPPARLAGWDQRG